GGARVEIARARVRAFRGGEAGRRRQAAFVTLPALMQRVHASTRSTLPSTMARTFWRFGMVRFLVLLFAWLTLLPTSGRFPQMSHFQAMTASGVGVHSSRPPARLEAGPLPGQSHHQPRGPPPRQQLALQAEAGEHLAV